jgi:hypothetical protein
MAETTLVGENVAVEVRDSGSRMGKTPFSWSAAIAGTLAALAVGFIIMALGSGIGLSVASPYGGPSATTLTIAGAIWLIVTHSFGFATGGYLAARLRSPASDGLSDETRFRDGAQGFVVWALGTLVLVGVAGWLALFAAGKTADVASGAAAGAGVAMSNPENQDKAGGALAYFVDVMFRPAPAGGGQAPVAGQPGTVGAAPATPGGAGAMAAGQGRLDAETRAEVARVLVRGVDQGGLTEEDRAYLAQLVAQRTGLPPDEAQRRVREVETKAKESAKEAADKAATAGAFFSFWSFMALLFGAVCATLAGMLGGELRDADSFGRRAEAAR